MTRWSRVCKCTPGSVTSRKSARIQYCAIAEDETGLADIISMFDKVYQPGTDAGQALCPDGAAPVDGYCFKYQADLEVVRCDMIGRWDESVPNLGSDSLLGYAGGDRHRPDHRGRSLRSW